MGLFLNFFEIICFSIGISFGFVVGFFLFIYSSESRDVKDPIIRPLQELDTEALIELLPEIPQWIKNPDYERVDWFNQFILHMWPYLDKAICVVIRTAADQLFAEYIGKYQIESVHFESLTFGTLPPTLHGVKIYETNEKEVLFEPVIKWAGNPNISLVLKVMSFRIVVQLEDLQIFMVPRVIFKPLVPTFPCFSNLKVSLMEKPHVDFGMKLLGGDIMAIPGLYHYVQETIRKQVAALYIWPRVLEIPILDRLEGMLKPVGILHVKVLRAIKLLKSDFIGTSDPYVKLRLSGDQKHPPKKTTVKLNNLNPVWNEEFMFTIKDPESQLLQLDLFDWEKVGSHDKLGMQMVPLKLLEPYETKSFTLDLLKSMDPNDPHNRKRRGRVVVEMTFNPFKDEDRYSGQLDAYGRRESGLNRVPNERSSRGTGLLLVLIEGAEDVEGRKFNNPYVLVIFRGEEKKTKMSRKTRNPYWNEEFQFMLEDAPSNDKIHIEVVSKRTGIGCGFRSKESLGHIDINLIDVVNNGCLNEKYHLINSRNGVIHVEMRWKTI